MAGWHEDFEDCPSIEERFTPAEYDELEESECCCGECDECSDRLWNEYEEEQDRLLSQQELEDFEQCDEYYGCSAEDVF